jgi:excisionase family DNA binding protein
VTEVPLPPSAKAEPGKQGVPRLALSPDEAAAALGCSRDFLDEHVLHELRVVRRGRRRFIPLRELERWLESEACRALER